jgi:hypothetical protein
MARKAKPSQVTQQKTARYKDSDIIAALAKTKGMVYLAAEVLGCQPKTIYNRFKTSPSVYESYQKENERSLDVAELQLIKQLNDGNTTALIFYLKTKGKRRGYVERVEVEHAMPSDLVKLIKELNLNTDDIYRAMFDELTRTKLTVNQEDNP